MNRSCILAGLILVIACSTPSSVAPINVPLQYKSMANPGDFSMLPACASLSSTRIQDARVDQTLGKRFVEGKSSPPAPVTTTSDVTAWVTLGVENALTKTGVRTGVASSPILIITIEQINTNENVLHRAGYDARIVISAELKASNGASCWNGRADGFAENYGYAGSAENYRETLNHALDRAILRILSMPEFRKSICSCSATSTTGHGSRLTLKTVP
jgi:uncharacterized lipoprotein YajG